MYDMDMPMYEEDYEAMEDARAMTRAKEVDKDPMRKKMAQKAMADKIEHLRKKADMMESMAEEKMHGMSWPKAEGITGAH